MLYGSTGVVLVCSASLLTMSILIGDIRGRDTRTGEVITKD